MPQVAPMLGIGYFELSRWLNDPDPKRRPHCLRRGKRYVRFTAEHVALAKAQLDTRNQRGAK